MTLLSHSRGIQDPTVDTSILLTGGSFWASAIGSRSVLWLPDLELRIGLNWAQPTAANAPLKLLPSNASQFNSAMGPVLLKFLPAMAFRVENSWFQSCKSWSRDRLLLRCIYRWWILEVRSLPWVWNVCLCSPVCFPCAVLAALPACRAFSLRRYTPSAGSSHEMKVCHK